MIAILAVLDVITARAITAPIALAPEAIEAAPTAAARALSVETLSHLPSQPVSVDLQCVAGDDGRLAYCIPADDGGASNIQIYRQRFFSVGEREKYDPIFAAALARMEFYRIRPFPHSGDAPPTVLVREVVSAADKASSAAPLGTIVKGGVEIEPDPLFTFDSFYPASALRAEAQARVSATCRVLDDRSLFCRDPKVDPQQAGSDVPLSRASEFDVLFQNATLRVFAAMHVKVQTRAGERSIGREVPFAINWRSP